MSWIQFCHPLDRRTISRHQEPSKTLKNPQFQSKIPNLTVRSCPIIVLWLEYLAKIHFNLALSDSAIWAYSICAFNPSTQARNQEKLPKTKKLTRIRTKPDPSDCFSDGINLTTSCKPALYHGKLLMFPLFACPLESVCGVGLSVSQFCKVIQLRVPSLKCASYAEKVPRSETTEGIARSYIFYSIRKVLSASLFHFGGISSECICEFWGCPIWGFICSIERRAGK